jgi:uncharacterized membrane protein (DUF485 family)
MHGPAQEWKKDNAVSLKELLGKWLFFIYTIIYAGFIIINVVSPKFMAVDVGRLNMAIVYGFGLIIFAMLLAFAFNHVSTHAEELLNPQDENEEGGC